MSTVCDFRDEFDQQVRALGMKVNSFFIADDEHYASIVHEVMEAKNRARKRPMDYRRLKRYDVVVMTADDDAQRSEIPLRSVGDVSGGGGGGGVSGGGVGDVSGGGVGDVSGGGVGGGVMTLVLPRRDDGTTTTTSHLHRRRYVHNGQLFDVLRAAHLDTDHGGLHRMHEHLRRRYANVTRPVVQIFLANCPLCRQRHRRRSRAATAPATATALRRPMQHARVDVVPDCAGEASQWSEIGKRPLEYGGGFILSYQDCATGFVVLRALSSPAAPEVCFVLNEVFCLFGAPARLDFGPCGGLASDRAYRDRVADQLLRGGDIPWPRIRIDWLAATEKTWPPAWPHDGSASLATRQYRYNNAVRPDHGRTPFEAMFGSGRCGGDGATAPDDDDVKVEKPRGRPKLRVRTDLVAVEQLPSRESVTPNWSCTDDGVSLSPPRNRSVSPALDANVIYVFDE